MKLGDLELVKFTIDAAEFDPAIAVTNQSNQYSTAGIQVLLPEGYSYFALHTLRDEAGCWVNGIKQHNNGVLEIWLGFPDPHISGYNIQTKISVWLIKNPIEIEYYEGNGTDWL